MKACCSWGTTDRKSTRLNSSHGYISYAVFCLKKKKSKSSTPSLSFFFFFNDTATTEIYTLSLHDALPISSLVHYYFPARGEMPPVTIHWYDGSLRPPRPLELEPGREMSRENEGMLLLGDNRSEEHTSELQSRLHLVCRLLLEKKKK